jgi:hypothetical protein
MGLQEHGVAAKDAVNMLGIDAHAALALVALPAVWSVTACSCVHLEHTAWCWQQGCAV